MRVTIIGAGIAGLACATELAERGAGVEILDNGSHLGANACSWFAGGMLAPWCESESASPEVMRHGAFGLDWWSRRFPQTVRNGTLVVAPARDSGELTRFARRTERFEWIDSDGIAALEPDLDGRFQKALFFKEEGHLDPRLALKALAANLTKLGVKLRFGVDSADASLTADRIIDCRGFAARDSLADLRGVRGEMLVLRTNEIKLSRPVRLLHPRIPLYIVPRGDGLFMVGATMIESAERGRISARSVIELLNGAFAVHPAFGEAEIVEMGADVRPAFPDNYPAIRQTGQTISLNGLFRHGFLLSPWFARQVADMAFDSRPDMRIFDDYHLERTKQPDQCQHLGADVG